MALAHYAAIAFYIDDVGQNFSLAEFSDPPSFDIPGNLAVNFIDGEVNTNAFFNTTSIPGGIAYTIFRVFKTDILGGVASFTGNGAAYGPSIFSVRNFLIESFIVTPPPCPADLTGDAVLNFFDVSAFLTAFSNADPVADFNNDGDFNFFDVSAFLSAFAAGCP